ncbi:hypothetical protein IWX90DRAFT_241601 [Phyllosticta citrichinensis]|uniref:Uncharacterized protein n=1 Tax=Phyllosticta citrichinensis TaxID=1130410 RepID=A0ABR1XQI9_9PEZI
MPSFYSLLSLGIFVNPALSTIHFRQDIHPGHGGPPPERLSEPPPSNQYLDQPLSSLAPPHQDSGRQRPVYDRPPHQAAAVIYSADSPALSSPEHENGSHSGHSGSLFTLCQESPLSTIIFGSITAFSPSNGFPVANFSSAGCTRTRSPHDPWAPGLAACQELGDEVRRCQELGNKVVLRIDGNGGMSRGSEGLEEGPTDGTTALPTDVENELADDSEQYLESGSALLRFKDAPDARRAALMLWKLFGQGDTHGPVGADSMRPLGDGVSVDGFDLAPFHRTSNTSPSQAYFFATFASTLHDLAHRRKNIKPCHISATPACLPAALFFFPYKVDELREAVDVVYDPVMRTLTDDDKDEEGTLEEGCDGRYRRVVEEDEAIKLWSALSVPQTNEEEDENGGDASGSEGEERDELKV